MGIDKKQGYFILAVGFLGTIINQFLKLIFRIPRPWVQNPEFTLVESARAEATGYSLPSGHTQNGVGVFGSVARVNKNKIIEKPNCMRLFFLCMSVLSGLKSPLYVLCNGNHLADGIE